jgi:acyl transferase domain-containing protein/thioesterase domain-containing protein
MSTGQDDERGQAIAVIGAAGRFAGADDLDAFWENVRLGRDTISRDDELETLQDANTNGKPFPKNYLRARGLLSNIDQFDADFFDFTPNEAAQIDPQHRVWLELCWHALEQAGYAHGRHKQTIGVWGGSFLSSYLYNNLIPDRPALEEFLRLRRPGSFALMVQNDPAFLPSRVAYKLDLRGPAINVQTGCSTSLVAVAMAVQSLVNYEVDIALAGGVCITIPQRSGYFYQEGAIYSRDGYCRPYDAKACGTVFGNGGGVVALKRLADAERDRDPIFGVIRGAATNNDGHAKVSYLAPSVQGQTEVIAMAQALAQISADTVGYVEGHGTATPMGDPIEVEALTRAFRESSERNGYCCLGSVKGNVGHLDAAAGIAGFLRALLALRNRTLPATAHFGSGNPQLRLDTTPFFVLGESRDWPAGAHPRRAAVSAFGIGGTNAHVVLEEYPRDRNGYDVHESSPAVLQISARSTTALDRYTAQLGSWIEKQITGELAPYPINDVAVTLRERRKQLEQRRAIRVSSFADAAHKLGDSSEWVTGNVVEGNPELAFLLPGQGSLMPNRLHGLLGGDVGFAERLRSVAALASDLLHFDLMGWYESADADLEVMEDNARTQLAVLCLSMAMADTLGARGIRPSVLLGHSLGEWSAAYVGGILTAEDAVRAVFHRGTLMQQTRPGRAVIVRASAEFLLPHLPETVTLACDNAQEICLLSGEPEPIEAFQAKLDDLGIGHQPTPIRVAVHSPLMDACVEPFRAELEKLSFHSPKLPILSAVTGDWLRPEDATNVAFWAAQLRACVKFRTSAKTLLRRSPLIGVEAGMGTALTSLLRTQITESKRHRCLAVLPTGRAASARDGDLLERVPLQLWTQGYELDFSGGRTHRLTTPVLPAYPFDRNRYWIDAPQAATERPASAAATMPPKTRGGSTHPPDATTSVAERLKRVLSKVSGVPTTKLATDVPFSAQGIESLILVLFAEQLNELFGLSLGYARLIECNTLDKLAASIGDSLVVDEAPKSVRPPPPSLRKDLGGFTGLVCVHEGDRRLPFLFVHGDRGVDLLNQVLPKEQAMYAYAHQGSDGEAIRYSTVEALAERCAKEWTRAIGNRPCVLAGHSYGGIVAYHLAYLLRELGQPVPLLVLVDSMHPRVFRNDERPGLLWLKREFSQRKRRLPYDLAYAKARAALVLNRKVPVDLRTDYILGAYERAVPNYEPPPIDADVVLYRATINMSGHPTNGWDEKRMRSLLVKDVEGSHLSVVRDEPTFETIASDIARRLTDLRAKPGRPNS